MRRDARIVGDFEDGAGHFVHGGQLVLALLGVGFHGAEFEDGERLAVEAGALLLEKNRPGRGQFDSRAINGNSQGSRSKATAPARQTNP